MDWLNHKAVDAAPAVTRVTPTVSETPLEKDVRLKKEAKEHKDAEIKAKLKHMPPQQHIMEFLQYLSQKLKSLEPQKASVAQEIDDYIRDHGNRYPETTKPQPTVVKAP